MTFEEIRTIALAFPDVTEQLYYGNPSFKVGKRHLAGIASVDSGTLVLKVPDPLEREVLLATQPDVYYLTDHYMSYEVLLVRMAAVDRDEFRRLFEQAWRKYAPKRLVATYERTMG